MLGKSLYLFGLAAALGLGLILGHNGWLAPSSVNAAQTLKDVPCPTVTLNSCKEGKASRGDYVTAKMIISGQDTARMNVSCGGGEITWFKE